MNEFINSSENLLSTLSINQKNMIVRFSKKFNKFEDEEYSYHVK